MVKQFSTPKADEDGKLYHRLTMDLSLDDYKRLKAIAKRNERSPSKQAKMMLLDILSNTKIITKKPS